METRASEPRRSSDVKIDWNKPLQLSKGNPGTKVSYLGVQSERDGAPITDAFAHLIIAAGRATYVDDFGRRAGEGGKAPYKIVGNVREPERAGATVGTDDIETVLTAVSDLNDDVDQLKALVHKWTEATGRLHTEMKATIEALRTSAKEQQEQLLQSNLMVIEDFKRIVDGLGKAAPAAAASAPASPVKLVTKDQRKPEHYVFAKADLEELEKIDSKVLKNSMKALMSHPLVNRVTVASYTRRPRINPEGVIRYHSDHPFGLLAKGHDFDKLRDLSIFLRDTAHRYDVIEFLQEMEKHQ